MQAGRVGPVLALAAAALVLWPTAPDARRATGEAVILAQAVSQPWPIKDFEVLNVEPAGIGLLGNVGAALRALNIDADNPLDLEVWKTVPLSNEVRTAIEGYLRESAEVLERWGFPPPRLEPVVTRRDGRRAYRVYLVSNLPDAAGMYHQSVCSWREPVIRLAAAHVIETFGNLPPRVTGFGFAVVGHAGTPGGGAGGPGRGTGPGGTAGESPDRAGRGLAGPGLTLQFLEGGAGALRSAPQAVQGTGSPTQVTVSSGAFTLALALPTEPSSRARAARPTRRARSPCSAWGGPRAASS